MHRRRKTQSVNTMECKTGKRLNDAKTRENNTLAIWRQFGAIRL